MLRSERFKIMHLFVVLAVRVCPSVAVTMAMTLTRRGIDTGKQAQQNEGQRSASSMADWISDSAK